MFCILLLDNRLLGPEGERVGDAAGGAGGSLSAAASFPGPADRIAHAEGGYTQNFTVTQRIIDAFFYKLLHHDSIQLADSFLLFMYLRVLGSMGAGAPARHGAV